MPKFSIIIPLFNKEQYISKTINSILSQSYKDYELIIVNDGSTDKSLQIVEKYKEDYTEVKIFSTPNKGVSNARNIGLENAIGDWIQFLDGDDLLAPRYLEKVNNVICENDIDIVFSDFEMINNDGKIMRTVYSSIKEKCTGTQICDYYISLQAENGFFGYISNKLFKRSLLNKLNYWFDITIKLAEDLDFYTRLYSQVINAYFLNEISFYYLQNEDNYIYNSNIDYYSQLVVRVNVKKWFQSLGKYKQYQELLDEEISRFVFFVLSSNCDNSIFLKKSYEKIINNMEIMDSVIPKKFSGFKKRILINVNRKDYKKIDYLFRLRNTFKAVYRRIVRSNPRKK